jgi:hypothetical protein
MLPSPRSLLAAALAALAVPGAASAATVTVGPGQTLQAAVDAAADGDTVQIPARTYSETVATAKQLTLAADPGAVLVNPAGATRATLAFTGTGGDTVTGLTVVSTVGDAVQAGGGTTSIQRAQLVTLAKGAAALSVTSATGDGARSIVADSTVLAGPISIAARYVSPTLAGAGITVSARHVTAIGNVVADASGAPAIGAQPISISFADSILRGAKVPVTGTGTVGAQILTDTRDDVQPTAADAGSLFVSPGAFDYHLRADAPVIDAGQTTDGESATDLDGDPRSAGPASDLGADEFVNRAPTAALTAPGRAVRQNRPATFDASRSSDPEAAIGGGIAGYHWDFGDGSTANTTSPTTTHAYAEKKTYSVTVTVLDRQGAVGGPSAPVKFTVIDGTPPTLTIGQPAAHQRIPLYKRARHGRKPRRLRVAFFGAAQDDAAIGKVYLALRAVATRNGACRWFDGRTKLVTAPCDAPVLVTPPLLNGGWRYSLPLRARLARGPYRLVAVAVDASGLPGVIHTVDFRFR